MREAVAGSAVRLREAGADVEEVRLPEEFNIVWQVHQVVGGPESTTFHAKKRADKGEAFKLVDPTVGERPNPGDLCLHGQRVRRWLYDRLERLYTEMEVEALLMPAAPGLAPKGQSSTHR